jgi:hypothetical protein
MFDIEAEAISSPMGEETFVISSNNGFRAQPIRQMADGRYRVVALNREGFFNRDFWALISSILLGVGITILVEQVISTLTRRRAADQRR